MEGATALAGIEWIVLCAGLFGGIVFLVISRRIESRRIERRFASERIVATSFGVSYFGRSTEPGRPLRSSGALVLLRDAIYYRARFRRRELYIPAESLRGIDIVQSHKGRPLYQKAIAVRFIDEQNRESSAAFRIPMPDRWLDAMRRTVLQHPLEVRDRSEESAI